MPIIEEKAICVTCPKGCALWVTRDGQNVLSVTGNGCKRGPSYAEQELSDPRRMVASSVRVKGGLHPLLPVYTSAPFPKPRIPELLSVLRKVEINVPVALDQVILKNVLETGIDIHASREMKKIENLSQ
jgi:CxxC motif-containing protein